VSVRRATTSLLVIAQVTTGAYLVIYLFRWQWNRALISGVLFVATEILLVGRLVLRRLQVLEDRLEGGISAEAVRVRLVETRPEPVDRFRWLRDASTRTNVFLPLLLGVGVFASAATWAVEGVARRTARPALERSLAQSLAPLAFPAGGFLDVPVVRPRPTHRGSLPRAPLVLAAVAMILAVGAIVDVVADATQTRPDRLEPGVTTLVDLRFRGDRALADPVRHAADLVQTCTAQSFRREIDAAAVFATGGDTVRVVLHSDLGEHGATRLRGCLEDVTLDRIQATVASISEVPAAP